MPPSTDPAGTSPAAADRPRGSGPGPLAPDGSAVAMYAALPAEDEVVAMLHQALPAGASVLDLGAGTGRLAAPLVALGHRVVAVDNSAEMLARIGAGIRTVCADIASLALPDRFGGVLLSGFLLDCSEIPRATLLRVCRRHLAAGGRVLIQRQPPEWYTDLRGHSYRRGSLDVSVGEIHWLDADRLAFTMYYRLGEDRWSHRVVSRMLPDEELPGLLAGAGLRFDRFLDDRRSWLAARAHDGSVAPPGHQRA
jgi:SAM-dependent methyltransferase